MVCTSFPSVTYKYSYTFSQKVTTLRRSFKGFLESTENFAIRNERGNLREKQATFSLGGINSLVRPRRKGIQTRNLMMHSEFPSK